MHDFVPGKHKEDIDFLHKWAQTLREKSNMVHVVIIDLLPRKGVNHMFDYRFIHYTYCLTKYLNTLIIVFIIIVVTISIVSGSS